RTPAIAPGAARKPGLGFRALLLAPGLFRRRLRAHGPAGGLQVSVHHPRLRPEPGGLGPGPHPSLCRAQHHGRFSGAAHPGGRASGHRADVQPVQALEARAQAKGMTLSVIIITKNEEAHIGACLDSVAFADEIIVVDSGSGDRTCAIAREKGARVVETSDWPGFGPQKNRALDLATQDWVLSVDADERVTPELAQAIARAIRQPAAQAYHIARL